MADSGTAAFRRSKLRLYGLLAVAGWTLLSGGLAVREARLEWQPIRKRAEADPAAKAEASTNGRNGTNGRQAMILDRGTVEYLVETFATLARLCQKAELRQAPVEAILRELTGRWQKLRRALAGSDRK